MAFDETLAARVRKALGKRAGIVEKKMFGGIAFLLRGNMCVGLHGNELIVRLDPEDGQRVLAEPNVRAFDLTGRPMKGWLLVAPGGLETDRALRRWVDAGIEFAASLPPKR
jgi:TfoX/Sxy family transcriptional regulator of competence genes